MTHRPQKSGNRHRMPLRGIVRRLGARDSAELAAHWRRLDRFDRHERFNGSIAADSLAGYLANLFSPGSIIFGYVENGRIRGVGELRPSRRHESYDAELAFSIEADWKRRGIGSRLLGALRRGASQHGYAKIGFETNSENVAMKALARKFGAKLEFAGGETFGVIEVPLNAPEVRMKSHPWLEGPHQAVLNIVTGTARMMAAGMKTFRP